MCEIGPCQNLTKRTISQDSFLCSSASFDSEKGASKRCVPTQTQIRQQLGSKLSDVFFEYVGNEGKAYLGLEPPLIGPDTVWISPDGRLKNKVSLTPVPEPQVLHLKALTHGSVIDVGQKYLTLLENKYRLQLEEELRKQAVELEEEFKIRMASTSESNMGEGVGQCKKIVATLMEHFDNCFNDLVKTTQLRMRKECQLKVEEERAEVASYMFTKLQDQVEQHDLELCSEFHDILYNELNILASRYIKQINNEREIAVQLMKETVRNYEKMLSDLKTEMELNSVVDVCQAIAQERIDCSERIRQIEKELKSKQDGLTEYIEQLKSENCTLQKMSTERLKRLMQWRKKVRELLMEFQKFINFSLKTVPGQSEFLLNMEKLMLKKFPQDSFLLPEDYLYYMKCIKQRLSSEEITDKLEPVESCEKSIAGEENVEEISGEQTPAFYPCTVDDEKRVHDFAFDYEQFQSMLMRKFSIKPQKKVPKKKVKKSVCLWKKKSKDIFLDKSNEFCQMLSLAGEDEKEHLAPVDCFLYRRLKFVQKLCEDDPEFTKIMLGCSDK